MRFKEFVTELFDPKHAIPLEWRKGGSNVLASGQLTIQGEPMTLDINFGLEDDGIVNIEFSVAGNFELTGKGGSTQVFSTVIEAVKEFVAKHPKATAFTFTADEKSRARMYDTLAKRVARDIGWHVVPHGELMSDPKYATLRSYGAFAFAIEKGQAPEHRQAGQKPQHGSFDPVYYVYSFELKDIPAIKIKAKNGDKAEMFVRRNVPEYKNADPMGIFASKTPPEGRQVVDMGEVPPEPPKAPERVLTPLEKALRDKLGA